MLVAAKQNSGTSAVVNAVVHITKIYGRWVGVVGHMAQAAAAHSILLMSARALSLHGCECAVLHLLGVAVRC